MDMQVTRNESLIELKRKKSTFNHRKKFSPIETSNNGYFANSPQWAPNSRVPPLHSYHHFDWQPDRVVTSDEFSYHPPDVSRFLVSVHHQIDVPSPSASVDFSLHASSGYSRTTIPIFFPPKKKRHQEMEKCKLQAWLSSTIIAYFEDFSQKEKKHIPNMTLFLAIN